MAALPLATTASCPEVAALYQPATQTITLNQPGKEPLKVEVPTLQSSASRPPLHGVLMALGLHMAPQSESLPPKEGMFEAMQPTALPDNTWRSAVMRCDLSELWVQSRGGFANSTRWYGPYKLVELMSARGDAALPSQ